METKAGIILLGQGEGIMKTKARIILLGLVMAVVFCYVTSVRADSDFATGAAAGSGGTGAAVNLDFQITIPSFLYFRVGSIGSIDQIQFAPTPTDVFTPGNITAGTGGDLGSGTVTVSLISNAGAIGNGVDITETNNSSGNGLANDDGTLTYINYAQINTATNNGNLPAPLLSNGGSNSVNIANTSGVITNEQAQWTYTYTNPVTTPAAGTYGGNGFGGRVTYTAAVP